MEYISGKGIELLQECKLPYEEQYKHFVDFMFWIKEGQHLKQNRKHLTGNGTCNAYLRNVFRFFLYLTDCGYAPPLKVLSYNQITVHNAVGVKRVLRQNSFHGYMRPKERDVRAAAEDEIIQILKACNNCRDQLLFLLLAETGFRIGELLGIKYTKDIDYEQQTISIQFREDNENEARAKNAEYRKAKISDDTFEFMLHYMSVYRELLRDQSFLFIVLTGETAGSQMTMESVYAMHKRIEKKTGIKITPHMLRRYFAVTRWDAGWPLELIGQALGHRHLDTTVKYLGVLDQRLMDASKEFYAKHSANYGIDKLL